MRLNGFLLFLVDVTSKPANVTLVLNITGTIGGIDPTTLGITMERNGTYFDAIVISVLK